jgi:hypothetical protein
MYVALLSTILVVFVLYLVSVASEPHIEVNVTVPGTQAACATTAPTHTPPADDLYDQLYAAAAPRMAADNAATGGITKPYEFMDTTGLQQIEAARSLATVAHAVAVQGKQRAPLEAQCSAVPDPCGEDVVWRNSFPGCGSFHIPLKAKDYAIDARVWQGDLNPKLQERMALLEKEWDPYAHQRARQAYLQLLATNFSSKSDKYMEAIDDLDDVDAQCLNEVEPVVAM